MVPPREENGDSIDDLPDSPTTDSSINIYPRFSTVVSASQSVRAKRMQVKNACTNCQKACKKCDPARPCLRCVRYGFGVEECLNSQRKERRKGAKRGPYKKRNGRGWIHFISGQFNTDYNQANTLRTPESESSPPPGGSHPTDPGADLAPVAYTPTLYAQYPLLPSHTPSGYFHQFYLTTAPSSARQEVEGSAAYPPPPQLFPATFLPTYPPPYPLYVPQTQTGPEGQMSYAGVPYASSAESPVLADDGRRYPSAPRER
ncbi:hypothetical protein B0H16DRAFT_1305660 [Mycena metata]|uniref:Zn(2)-C6 fungal-type domain-containing protein n=1 Tax=Mycena metata TaxID=1033252 RepID=A0AAD7JWP3_9AGAR|nr:hypothetical protein B0H16DRAFT_1305660 [Mycena metata]